MGIFGDFGTIRKIYKKLESIEADMINIEKCKLGLLNPIMLAPALSSITCELQDLYDIVNNSSQTVLAADFKFCNRNLPIRRHLDNIATWLNLQIEEIE